MIKKKKEKPETTEKIKDEKEVSLLIDAAVKDAEEKKEKTAEKKEETKSSEISDLEVAKKMIKISQSAESRKLDFNLTFETVKRLMSYKTCYYTGKPFGEEGSLAARSFDRVDSSKGYVEGNVVACTVDINQKKANLTVEEIACLYNKLIKKSQN